MGQPCQADESARSVEIVTEPVKKSTP
jgi:hypothetical protein